MKRAFCCLLVFGFGLCWLGLTASEAHARKPYKDQFDKKYIKADSKEEAEKNLTAAVAEAKCTVCHVGENKKQRNVYGQALAKLLKSTDQKDVEKIVKSLETVEKEHSDPKNDKSPTFGDLIKAGKLPAPAAKEDDKKTEAKPEEKPAK